MKDLKFRAWLKEYQKMVQVIDLDFEFQQIGIDDFTSEEYGRYLFIYFSNIELMQYTGLKDKNGVEIYEGDIVKAAGYPAIEVVYDKESCSFKIKVQYIGWEDLLILSSNKTPHLEVIGNIYQNPELLKKI